MDGKISDHNILLYERYTDHALSDGASPVTVGNMHNTILPFLKWLGDMRVEDVDEDKIYAYFRHQNQYRYKKKSGETVGYAHNTLYQQKAYIKKFLAKYNQETAKTIKNPKSKKRKLPSDILNENEIKRLIKGCLSARDRAIIATLYETGMRKGEMFAMRLRDVVFDMDGAIINIPEKGKTGARRNRVVFCVSYLHEWIDNHPQKDNREAILFCSNQVPYPHISKSGLQIQLDRICKRAGITKHVTPHLFRHSRATHLAKFMTEQQLKIYLGWSADSTSPAVYVHLAGKDIDNVILKHYGRDVDEKQEETLTITTCPRCKALVPEGDDYCRKCGTPISEELRLKEKRDEDERIKLIAEDAVRVLMETFKDKDDFVKF
jgi:integrase/recombinase XerD